MFRQGLAGNGCYSGRGCCSFLVFNLLFFVFFFCPMLSARCAEAKNPGTIAKPPRRAYGLNSLPSINRSSFFFSDNLQPARARLAATNAPKAVRKNWSALGPPPPREWRESVENWRDMNGVSTRPAITNGVHPLLSRQKDLDKRSVENLERR